MFALTRFPLSSWRSTGEVFTASHSIGAEIPAYRRCEPTACVAPTGAAGAEMKICFLMGVVLVGDRFAAHHLGVDLAVVGPGWVVVGIADTGPTPGGSQLGQLRLVVLPRFVSAE